MIAGRPDRTECGKASPRSGIMETCATTGAWATQQNGGRLMAGRFLSRMRWPSRGDLAHWGICLFLVLVLWAFRSLLAVIHGLSVFLCYVTGQNYE